MAFYIDSPGNANGQFVTVVPGVTQPVKVTSVWLNMLQNEVANLVQTGGGLTLNKADSTQVLQSVERLANNAQAAAQAFATVAANNAQGNAETYTRNYAFAQTASFFSTGGLMEIPTPQGTFMIQWGYVNLPADSVSRNYAYPTVFPHAAIFVNISYGASVPPSTGAPGAQVSAGNTNVSSFLANNTAPNSGGNSNGCYFIAFGY